MNSSCSCTEVTKNMIYKAEITGNSLRKLQKEGNDIFFCIPIVNYCVQ